MFSRILARCATRSLGEAMGLASGSAARSGEGEHSTVVLRLGGAACSGGGSADLGGPGGVSAAAACVSSPPCWLGTVPASSEGGAVWHVGEQ